MRGTPGRGTKQKIRGRWVNMTNIEPINGVNIRTTIDIKIQDITEKALVEKLSEIEAESGTAIVMEVATGENKSNHKYRTHAGRDIQQKLATTLLQMK